MTRRRVVITGLGVVSSHGDNAKTAIDSIFRGVSAIGSVNLESDGRQLTLPGAVLSSTPWVSLHNAPTSTCDRVSLLALVAAQAAIDDAKLSLSNERLDRVGVAVGTSLGGIGSQDFAYEEIFAKKKERLSPFTLVKVMYNGPAAQIALRHRLTASSITYTTTCSSSSVAIGEAMRNIRHGYSDIMIAGGAEALFTYVSLVAWQALHVLAPPDVVDISRSCRPFSLDRNGTVLGEGAAFVILEELDRAIARGAHIYAELAGYGVSNDSLHLTQPSLDGQVRAMRSALADADLHPNSIDYLNAHGTGTKLNDLTETLAVKTVFGEWANQLAISSTKAVHGHLVGAAGALELIVGVSAIQRQYVPPTANLTHSDPQCDLDFVPNVGRARSVSAVMSNSFAVGGTAAVLIAQRIN